MQQIKTGILFQDGCVLQRDKEIPVWGEGPEGAEVTVVLEESRAVCRVKDGKWKCVLPPRKAARGLTMTVTCNGETIRIQDISVGEVWIAGGQSNMEYFLCYDADWETMKTAESNPEIHMFNVPRLAYPGHEKDVSECGYWFREGDKAWPYFSTPGYSFARSIQPILKVPVGIIGCNWGGTSASTWMKEECLQEAPLDIYLKNISRYRGEGSKRRKSFRGGFALEDSKEHGKNGRRLCGFSLKEQKEWQENRKKRRRIPWAPIMWDGPEGCIRCLRHSFPAGRGAFSGIRENRTKDMRIYTTGFSRP
ncbi:MAG: sialate O-acetylesterase [Eisenbergiella sp.]